MSDKSQRVQALVDSEITEYLRLFSDIAKSPEIVEFVCAASTLLTDTFARGGKLMTAGNGGSFADAQHTAAEFTGRLRKERPPLPAMVLGSNASSISAIANDYGYKQIFARELAAFGQRGDCLWIFSTSGNSENIVQALATAGESGISTIAFLGRGGGEVGGAADLSFCVPWAETDRTQEVQMFLAHLVCLLVDMEY